MMIGYHFVGETLRDGRSVPFNGEWLEHDGRLLMCESGLHWSKHPFDALRYAPGATLCLVECDGITICDDDKCVSSRRKIIKRIDATGLLRGFARWQAYQVLHLWNAPDVVVEFINTGDESLRSATRDAAWDAAWGAARSAARSAAAPAWGAAWDAAQSAAQSAAKSAAWGAARSAARSAAQSAAWDAAWDAARSDAAKSAAWDAARSDAARSAARDDFQLLVDMAFTEIS